MIRCFEVLDTGLDITIYIWSKNAGRAKYRTKLSAEDAGYETPFSELRCKRYREFDWIKPESIDKAYGIFSVGRMARIQVECNPDDFKYLDGIRKQLEEKDG